MVPEGRDWSYQADGDCADLKGLVHVSGIDVVEGEQLSLGSSPSPSLCRLLFLSLSSGGGLLRMKGDKGGISQTCEPSCIVLLPKLVG